MFCLNLRLPKGEMEKTLFNEILKRYFGTSNEGTHTNI